MRALIAAIVILAIGWSALAANGDVHEVSAGSVRMRGGPGQGYPVIGGLQWGDQVHEIERSGAWIKVLRQVGDRRLIGWVHGSLLTPKALKATPRKTESEGSGSGILLLVGLIALGWFLFFRRRPRSPSYREGGPRSDRTEPSLRIQVAGPHYGGRSYRQPSSRPDFRWVKAGESVSVAGYDLSGGMLYVGESLAAINGFSMEPALISPSLKVTRSNPDRSGQGMHYWPSYDGIPPRCRAAYLEWLASGRRDPAAYIGYVFLYFYGLERRALYDALESDAAKGERSVIRSEVEQLLEIYGSNRSFYGYSMSFLGALRVLDSSSGGARPEPPSVKERSYGPPPDLKLALGEFSRAGEPIPAEWAFAWAFHTPDIHLRTPATRCPEEFRDLFLRRYAQRFGEGLVVKPNKTSLKLSYRPASASFGGVWRIPVRDLPDVGVLKKPVDRLREIVDECTNEMEPYSRWLGRNHGRSSTLEAIALLPIEIVTARNDPGIAGFRKWMDERVSGGEPALVSAADLLGSSPLFPSGALGKVEALAIAQLLAKLGYGIEPDVRFGGPVLDRDGSVAIFRLDPGAASAPTAEYAGASLLFHLGVAVAAADEVVEEEASMLFRHLETALRLDAAECRRLRAHLVYLLDAKPGLSGLKKRVAQLSADQKISVADLLIAIAGADGRITNPEISTLRRSYSLLGLNPDDVYSHLHALASSPEAISPAATEPVTVLPATEKKVGYKIPEPPAASPAQESYMLDMRRVEAKIAESAAVSALLSDIFAGEEPEPATGWAAAHAGATSSAPSVMPGLDPQHNALLGEVLTRDNWSRVDWEELCNRHGLLADGALETINEAAFDVHGAPLLEGEDPALINQDLVRGIAK